MSVVERKIALVTGGLSGIGLAMTKELLINNGAKGVAIVDVSKEANQVLDELSATFGTDKILFIRTDVTNRKELEEAFEKTIDTFKQLDIVINNAGIIDERNWEKTIAINLVAVVRGSYLAMEKYLPKYRSGEEGIIVNTASVLGFKAVQSLPIYCATKHGIVSLGQSLGGEEYYKRYKVRVLTICPGVSKTSLGSHISCDNLPLLDKAKEEMKQLSSIVQSPEHVGQMLIKILKEGKTGSLWVVEDEEPPYEVVIPERTCMKI